MTGTLSRLRGSIQFGRWGCTTGLVLLGGGLAAFLTWESTAARAEQVQLAAVSQSKPAAQWPASDQAAKTAENFPLPVYASLGANPHFRDGLHLSDRQQRKLREISDRYLRKRQAFYERFQASFDALPSDDREAAFLKKTLQIREKLAKRFRKKIESVLSPERLLGVPETFRGRRAGAGPARSGGHRSMALLSGEKKGSEPA